MQDNSTFKKTIPICIRRAGLKLCYQLATPDVAKSPLLTAYQGKLKEGFKRLRELGYDGAELMVRDPEQLDLREIVRIAQRNNIDLPMLCTGEVYGQDKLSLIDRHEETRKLTFQRIRKFVDIASSLSAQVNIGRVRGQFYSDIPKGTSYRWAIDAFKMIADYAEKKNVTIALEPINILQCNFINTTHEAIQIGKEISSERFKIMLDLFHMHIEDKDIGQSIKESKDCVSYVHLTDSNRRIPGSCKINFKDVLLKLTGIGYDGPLGVEVFQIPDQDTAMKESIKYLKPILNYLDLKNSRERKIEKNK